MGRLNLGKTTAAARAALPIPTRVCNVFMHPGVPSRLPMFGIFNMRADVDKRDCTRGLYGHRKGFCAGS